ncbi:hypothetical protein ACSV9I_04490 [Rhizobium sp. G187]|uniref:hypothetical protein n=1 Tax=Rhizobium sp. G187 TaxID=3451352 RepID=UPI003EE4FA35
MNYHLIAPIAMALALSGCQASKSASSYNEHVEATASACADEVAAKKDAKKLMGSIMWNAKATAGHMDSVDLPYVELGADKGAAWRACMASRGVPVDTLDLGEREVEPRRLPDIG